MTTWKSTARGRPSSAVGKTALLLASVLCSTVLLVAQSKSPRQEAPRFTPAEAARRGKALVADLLARLPEPSTNGGVLRIRDPQGAERELPARFEIAVAPTHWVSTYEVVLDPQTAGVTRLTVIHRSGLPNEYHLAQTTTPDWTNAPVRRLTETMVPFAGSEFWVADLGLEFLHWPQQNLLKKEMRRGQSCDVLESINPNPAENGYSRVVSWVDIDTGGIVHADAYDARNELLKLFDPTALQKVDGQRQLKEMEMRNRKTGARSWINFERG